jgi:RNA-directed DNA polymerase
MARISSISEKPRSDKPRRLVDWLNPTGARKVHSLVDKIYKKKNLEIAWEKVRKNKGCGGVDGQGIEEFEMDVQKHLDRLHDELRTGQYSPNPVLQHLIPKAGQAGKFRPLGIPTIFDRVCQQAILNRLEGIFEPLFDEASFGYRRERSTKDALRKVWKEIGEGYEWIVDADLENFFGTADHEKVMTLLHQQIADGRVLELIESILKAGCMVEGRTIAVEQGVPQGGSLSPLISNILLTPFDWEMRRKGYRLTRYSDDWVITCRTKSEAQTVLRDAEKVLEKLGVTLNSKKTRIIHVRGGFEFLGYKIKQGSRPLKLSADKIKSGLRAGQIYAYPTQKSLTHFKDQIRKKTQRKIPLSTEELIAEINPIIRGWGNYYKKAHVRKLFSQLRHWIVHRIWSHCHKRWRNCGWKTLPESKLYGELKLVNLISLIPSIAQRKHSL